MRERKSVQHRAVVVCDGFVIAAFQWPHLWPAAVRELRRKNESNDFRYGALRSPFSALSTIARKRHCVVVELLSNVPENVEPLSALNLWHGTRVAMDKSLFLPQPPAGV